MVKQYHADARRREIRRQAREDSPSRIVRRYWCAVRVTYMRRAALEAGGKLRTMYCALLLVTKRAEPVVSRQAHTSAARGAGRPE